VELPKQLTVIGVYPAEQQFKYTPSDTFILHTVHMDFSSAKITFVTLGYDVMKGTE
jgi:hypothetical protein